jgi:hypothetical protein
MPKGKRLDRDGYFRRVESPLWRAPLTDASGKRASPTWKIAFVSRWAESHTSISQHPRNHAALPRWTRVMRVSLCTNVVADLSRAPRGEGRSLKCTASKAQVFGSDVQMSESGPDDRVYISVAVGTPQDGSKAAQRP